EAVLARLLPAGTLSPGPAIPDPYSLLNEVRVEAHLLAAVVRDTAEDKAAVPEFVYESGFHAVTWNGDPVEFTPNQARALSLPWEPDQRGSSGSGRDLLRAAGSNASRPSDLFKVRDGAARKPHPAWNTLITAEGCRKGHYRLALAAPF